MTKPLIDSFGRHITYVRLSVTDRCDLRCTYCMPEKMKFLPRKDLLTLEELGEVAVHFVSRGVNTIRVTGGEPLVRRDIMQLFEQLGRLRAGGALNEFTMTTNGTRLADFASALADLGMQRINVSLDTLDPVKYRDITRGGALQMVLDGIDAALDAGIKVKLNTVALRHDNADEIPSMIDWAHGKGIAVSLIETMPLGETGEDRVDQYLPLTVVRDALEARWTLSDSSHTTSGPSRYVEVEETGGVLGFITPLTNNFCASCNRVRVTCTGTLYGCLGRSQSVDLRTALRTGADMNAILDEALLAKPKAHDFEITESGTHSAVDRHMSLTGG